MVGGQCLYVPRVGGMLSVTSNTQFDVVAPPVSNPPAGPVAVGVATPMSPGNPGAQQCGVNPTGVGFQHMP